ncbi:hypothetical protein ACVWWJ_001844 [Luteibacter sp. HA06]|jgi:hypothetical protein
MEKMVERNFHGAFDQEPASAACHTALAPVA